MANRNVKYTTGHQAPRESRGASTTPPRALVVANPQTGRAAAHGVANQTMLPVAAVQELWRQDTPVILTEGYTASQAKRKLGPLGFSPDQGQASLQSFSSATGLAFIASLIAWTVASIMLGTGALILLGGLLTMLAVAVQFQRRRSSAFQKVLDANAKAMPEGITHPAWTRLRELDAKLLSHDWPAPIESDFLDILESVEGPLLKAIHNGDEQELSSCQNTLDQLEASLNAPALLGLTDDLSPKQDLQDLLGNLRAAQAASKELRQ